MPVKIIVDPSVKLFSTKETIMIPSDDLNGTSDNGNSEVIDSG